MQETQTLEKLDLSHNNFRQKGGEILADGIGKYQQFYT